jgi:hypothetical protein
VASNLGSYRAVKMMPVSNSTDTSLFRAVAANRSPESSVIQMATMLTM